LRQLEDALRATARKVAVYFESDCLVVGDASSVRLAVRRN